MLSLLKRVVRSPWAMVLAALALRLGVMALQRTYVINPEMDHYDFGFETGRVARAIAAGEGFSSPLHGQTGPTAWLMPAYPYLLAGIFTLFGIYTTASAVVAIALNCTFSALTCLPIYHIGRKTLGEGVALGAGWAWVFYFWSIHVATEWIWDTSLFALLLAWIFLLSLDVERRASLWAWAGFGLLCGGTVLLNTSLAAVLPFLGLWICWQRSRRAGWLTPVATAAVAFLLSLVPWVARNYLVFEGKVLLRSNFGLELYLGNVPNAENDIFASTLHPSANAEELQQFQRLGEVGYMAEKTRQAKAAIAADPGEFAQRCVLRVMNWWAGPWEAMWKHWQAGRIGVSRRILITATVGLLGLLGLALAWRDGRPGAPLFAIFLLAFPLVYYFTQANARYRLAVDPLLLLLAVYAVARMLPGARQGESRHA